MQPVPDLHHSLCPGGPEVILRVRFGWEESAAGAKTTIAKRSSARTLVIRVEAGKPNINDLAQVASEWLLIQI